MHDYNEIDLPFEIEDETRRALVSVWWTGMLMKKAFRRIFKSQLQTEAHFNLLWILQNSERPLTQNDLGRKLLVDKSNVTNLVDRLEKDGLIKRNSVESDRRRYHITLTAKGRELIGRTGKTYMNTVQKVMSPLTAKESKTLAELTQKLRRGLAQIQQAESDWSEEK